MTGSKLTMRAFPVFFLLCFIAVFASSELEAQRRHGSTSPLDTVGKEPSQKDGWEILQKFRQLWQPSGYRYHFELKISPRRGKSRYVSGVMVGETNERGVATRLDVTLKGETATDDGELLPALTERYLLQSGLLPYAMELRSDEDGAPQILDTDELFAPIAESHFTPFDLMAPYVYWQRFVYEGRMTRLSRPVHVFVMYPPDDDAKLKEHVSYVRLLIDNQFNGLVEANIYGTDDVLLKTLSLTGFRKVDGYWIFGGVALRDEIKREKTLFTVTDAAVGLDWPEEMFTPQSLMSDLASGRIFPGNAAFFEKLSAE